MLRLALAASLCGVLSAQAPAGFGPETGFVTRYCFDCHGGDTTKGELDLGAEPPDRVLRLDRLRRVAARLRAGEMPPPDEERPTAAERDAFLGAAVDTLRREVPTLPPAPGRVTIRRLNKAQWRRTIADLFGVEVETAGFPADDLGYGFDTVGDALSFSTLHLEKLVAAAGAVAELVFDGEDPERPTVRRFEAEAMALAAGPGVGGGGDHANLYTRAELEQRLRLPRDGLYRLRIVAAGDQAGDEPPKMVVRWDGRALETFEVPGRQFDDFLLEARLTAGDHRLGLAFVNDYYEPKNPDPQRRDRNLRIDRCEVIGPTDARAVPEPQRWVHAAVPAAGDDAERVRAFVPALLLRAWRRPPTAAEVERHAAVGADALRAGEGLNGALRLVLQAALCSPHFLFRGELDGVDAGGAVAPVPSIVLASRLSYFVWASTPDEALLAAGREGRLLELDGLLAEARRLLADPRADALATEFAAQWLELRNLADLAPDPDRFPGFDPALRAALRTETELLFRAVLREGRDVRDLLDCDFTHVDERLAAFYGIPYPAGSTGFVRVALPPALRHRGGVLGHASVLAVTSNPTRTSPVKRGRWILDNLLGAPPPPPPPGSGSLPDEEGAVDSTGSFREQLAQHRSRRRCAVCHVRMDALGLALERFDAVGRYRERDAGGPIDCSGELPDGRRVDGLADLKRVLRADPAFVGALARKLFVYAIGREPGPADRLKLEHAVDGLLRGGAVTIRDLVLAIVASDAFRLREVERER